MHDNVNVSEMFILIGTVIQIWLGQEMYCNVNTSVMAGRVCFRAGTRVYTCLCGVEHIYKNVKDEYLRLSGGVFKAA